MISFALFFSAGVKLAPAATPPATVLLPAREARCLDLAYFRERTLPTRSVRLRPAALTARAYAVAAWLRSWWDRTAAAAAADVLRLPAADGVPPRTAVALRGQHDRIGLRPVGLAVRPTGGDR